EAAAADAATRDDRDVLERGQAEDALHSQLRAPEVAPHIARVLRKLVVSEAPAALQHADRVALLRQPQRRDAAAEAGADNQPVVVLSPLRRGHRVPPSSGARGSLVGVWPSGQQPPTRPPAGPGPGDRGSRAPAPRPRPPRARCARAAGAAMRATTSSIC